MIAGDFIVIVVVLAIVRLCCFMRRCPAISAELHRPKIEQHKNCLPPTNANDTYRSDWVIDRLSDWLPGLSVTTCYGCSVHSHD